MENNNLNICTRRNQFILNLATFLSANLDVNKLAEDGDKSQEKLNEVIMRLQESGNDNLRVIDLTNVANIADNELFTEDYDQLINFINVSKENVKTLEALDIDVTGMSFKDIGLACYQISKIPAIVANTIMTAVLNDNAEDGITDLYINAIANICAERMNRELFLEENDLIPAGQTAADVKESYTEAYQDWVIDEAVRILTRLKAYPMKNVVIHPVGLAECKKAIKEVFPINTDTSWIDDIEFEDMAGDIFTKHIQDSINSIEGLDVAAKREMYMKIWQHVVEMNDKNAVGQMDLGEDANSTMGKGNIISAVNIPEVTAHIFILASNDMYGKDGVLEPTTEYLKDIFGAVLDQLDLPYGKYTTARLISTHILAVPYPIASSMLLKTQDRNFMNIAQSLGMILSEAVAKKMEEIEALKKGDADGNNTNI